MPTPVSSPSALFTADDLGGWVGRTVNDGRAATVERVVWGWLETVLGADQRPQPVPAQVFSWAVELGAIALENPSGLSSEELGPARRAFSAERRAQILQEAARGFNGASGAGSPTGSFPPPACYPDPAMPAYRW